MALNRKYASIPGRISVVMPCYNAASYVREAIDSVLGQSYPDVELMVVDDAPRMEPEMFWTDETALSLALYDLATQFGDCVRDVRNEQPQGFTWARNRGVEAAMPSSLVRI